MAGLADCACWSVREASRSITGLYDECLRPAALRATQYTLLMTIDAADSPFTITELSDILMLNRTTLSRDLQPLERRGLVSITEGKDRRSRLVAITPQGKELLTLAIPLWEQAQARILNGLGEDRYASMLEHMSEIVKLTRRK